MWAFCVLLTYLHRIKEKMKRKHFTQIYSKSIRVLFTIEKSQRLSTLNWSQFSFDTADLYTNVNEGNIKALALRIMWIFLKTWNWLLEGLMWIFSGINAEMMKVKNWTPCDVILILSLELSMEFKCCILLVMRLHWSQVVE